MEIKSAKELYGILKNKIPDIVDKTMNGIEEHISEKSLDNANKGVGYCRIRLNPVAEYAAYSLILRCLDLSTEYEDKGYKVSIDDIGNKENVQIVFTVSWDRIVHPYYDHIEIRNITVDTSTNKKRLHIYDTDNNVNTEYKYFDRNTLW